MPGCEPPGCADANWIAGSITGGGTVIGDEVQWNAGVLADAQALSLSYQVTVNEDAVGAGVQTGLLESTPGIAADEIQSTPGPTLWNLVSLCGIIEGDVNCSCKVDSQDAQLLGAHWGEGVNDPTFEPTLDLDGNFETNVIDVMKAVVHWNETCSFNIEP